MIGYGFMGRAHSNAYRKVNNFFDLEYQPVLKAVCARNADKAKAFADNWGYESVETDWRKLIERKDIDAIDICTPNNLHAEIAIAAAKAGKMILCEKPLAMNAAEGAEDGRGGREGRRAEHGLVQLPPRAGRHARQAAHRRGQARAASSTTAPSSCRTGRSPPTCRKAAPACGGSTSSAAGSGVTGDLLAHCIDTALWLNGAIDQRHRHDRDVRQGAQAHPHRQGREGRHRRRLRVPVPLRQRLAGHVRIDPLRPRPQGALHVRDQRRERLDRLGPARPAPPAVLRPPRRGRSSAAGARSTSPTATIPTWSNWWVPGLQIGYEHTLRPPGRRLPRRPGQAASRPRPTSATRSRPTTSATRC